MRKRLDVDKIIREIVGLIKKLCIFTVELESRESQVYIIGVMGLFFFIMQVVPDCVMNRKKGRMCLEDITPQGVNTFEEYVEALKTYIVK